MKEIAFQKKGDKLVPFSEEDLINLKSFQDNQILKAKISGVRKQRSYKQLKLFWACCRTVSENTKDQHWDTSAKVAEQIKHALQFYDTTSIIVLPDGTVKIPVRSISYKNLGHMDAISFFDRAFPVMAKKIGITVEELLKNADTEK